jgi:hypothetical protein
VEQQFWSTVERRVFYRVGPTWTYWAELLINDSQYNDRSALLVEPKTNGNYNQGIRINRSSGVYSGLVLGGKAGTFAGVDPAGYDATTPNPTATLGNATWDVRVGTKGDFTIGQTHFSSPPANSRSSLIYGKRSGEAYVGGNKYPINIPLVLNSDQLGLSTTGTILSRSSDTKTLQLRRIGNIVVLNGYLGINASFTGSATSDLTTELAIPNEHLPLASSKTYTMMVAGFDHVGSNIVKSKGVVFYLPNPSSKTGSTKFILRCGSVAAGEYNECFFDSTWILDD